MGTSTLNDVVASKRYMPARVLLVRLHPASTFACASSLVPTKLVTAESMDISSLSAGIHSCRFQLAGAQAPWCRCARTGLTDLVVHVTPQCLF